MWLLSLIRLLSIIGMMTLHFESYMIKFLKSTLVFRLISIVFLLYLLVAILGNTYSYKEVFNSFVMFVTIWLLGSGSTGGIG